jgi:cytochrome c biogenesis protein CcdA
MAPAAAAGGLRAYAAYGLAYAAASLGCALPIFLSVVGVAAASSGPLAAVGQFLLYGAGMALVVTVLTIAAALFKTTLLSQVRQAGAGLLDSVTGVLLVLTGAYVTAYWVTLGF